MKKGLVVWICGLAGSGKSTIAREVRNKLSLYQDNVIYLDGDELREILGNFDYDRDSRIEMAKKRALMANFLAQQGMIVLVSTISLFNEIYTFNRALMNSYCEIFVDCDFEELLKRDQKNLYSNAINKKITNVVGVDIPFDIPQADLVVYNNKQEALQNNVAMIIETIQSKI
ncbi:adenylyl-sulfate kinase [Helicobacter sp. faydin-H20]|uniref:adenylyl-sulfate kinase n=1 Tax=Helicobacter anatolicus TaxID=2905874 RepID=UPI001E6380A5|nr:adenylyl-sulfate kinase [Helicobacter anatolicus]